MHLRSTSLIAALLLAHGCTTMRPTRSGVDPIAPRMPLSLVPNAGQWPDHVCFAAPAGGLWVERDAIVLAAGRPGGGRQVLRLRVVDAAPGSAPVGGAALPGSYNYFLGADPSRWRTDLAACDSVRWPAVRPGVDLVLTLAGGDPEYLFELAPGADLAGLRVRCEGTESVALDGQGALHVRGKCCDLVQSPPRAFRVGRDGQRGEVSVRFVPVGADTFGFAVDGHAGGDALCIDPMLQWATYVGGSAYEWGYGVSRQADGTVLVAGETTSSDFPTTAGAVDPSYNGSGPPTSDAFVARIRADGTGVIYASYLGGSSGDKAFAVTGNGAGEATVVGTTTSTNFPTTASAFDRTLGGSSDGFVARLSADGHTLLFSTYLGGSDGDEADAVTLDPGGDAWVAGVTSSMNFPVTAGTFQTARSGASDAYIARIAANGTQVLACTLLGGADGDVGKGIAIVPDGSILVGGTTSSADFPTTAQAMQRVLRGSSDAFLARFSPDCRTLLAATLCGGSNGESGEAVGIGAGGLLLLAGVSASSDFPVSPGAWGTPPSGSSDAFVLACDLQLGRRHAALFGGSSGDVPKAVFGVPDGTIVVAGQTSSANYPTTPGAVLAAGSGSADAFVSHLAADLSGLLCSTLFGGSGSDGGEHADGQDADAVALTGVTNSRNMPTSANAWSGSQLGTNDAFVAVLDVRAPGVVRYGSSTPACLGPIHAAVTRWPAAGASDFAFSCIGAPPSAFGFLVLGFTPAPGLPVFGITAWLDPTQPLLTAPAFADSTGFARVPLSLASVGAGARFFVQFVWFNPPGCGTPGGLSASDALDVTVQ
jgi:hypothetical protein